MCYDSYMTIKIQYFASLREKIGRSSDELELTSSMTVIDAWKQATDHPEMFDDLLIAVNQEYSSSDTLLKEGDEVAFFPPVTGG